MNSNSDNTYTSASSENSSSSSSSDSESDIGSNGSGDDSTETDQSSTIAVSSSGGNTSASASTSGSTAGTNTTASSSSSRSDFDSSGPSSTDTTTIVSEDESAFVSKASSSVGPRSVKTSAHKKNNYDNESPKSSSLSTISTIRSSSVPPLSSKKSPRPPLHHSPRQHPMQPMQPIQFSPPPSTNLVSNNNSNSSKSKSKAKVFSSISSQKISNKKNNSNIYSPIEQITNMSSSATTSAENSKSKRTMEMEESTSPLLSSHLFSSTSPSASATPTRRTSPRPPPPPVPPPSAPLMSSSKSSKKKSRGDNKKSSTSRDNIDTTEERKDRLLKNLNSLLSATQTQNKVIDDNDNIDIRSHSPKESTKKTKKKSSARTTKEKKKKKDGDVDNQTVTPKPPSNIKPLSNIEDEPINHEFIQDSYKTPTLQRPKSSTNKKKTPLRTTASSAKKDSSKSPIKLNNISKNKQPYLTTTTSPFYNHNIINTNRLLPYPDNIPEVHFIGELSHADGFNFSSDNSSSSITSLLLNTMFFGHEDTNISNTNLGSNNGPTLSCKFTIEWGDLSWSFLEGEYHGQTQYSPQIWNHPIDIHFALMDIRGWPRIFCEIWELDDLGRTSLVGYGFSFLPNKPGTHAISIHCWRPITMIANGNDSNASTIIRSNVSELHSFFLGANPQLASVPIQNNNNGNDGQYEYCPPGDLLFNRAWEDRSRLVTTSTGRIHLSISVIHRFFGEQMVDF